MIDHTLIHAGRACVMIANACEKCRFYNDYNCIDMMIVSLANELEKAVSLLRDDEEDRVKKITEAGA